jgi:hypothetical protein
MSKLAHSNEETMAIIEQQAEEESWHHAPVAIDPPEVCMNCDGVDGIQVHSAVCCGNALDSGECCRQPVDHLELDGCPYCKTTCYLQIAAKP